MPSNLIIPWNNNYDDYLSDESRRTGAAESISFPESENDVIEIVNIARSFGQVITAQGARTGITAGAVPERGHILNLSRMNTIGNMAIDEQSGEHRIKVQPGVTLTQLRERLLGSGLFFPPDPTEATASIGGMVACNASGAATYCYGPTRDWISALRVILADGSVIALRRGDNAADGRRFSLATLNGRIIEGSLPSYTQPSVKSAAGYYVSDNIDLIDIFIGMEGTLGIITEIELKLIPRPNAICGLMAFIPSEEAAIELVQALRREQVDNAIPLAAIEFFNSDALNLLRNMRAESSAFKDIPCMKPHFHTAIYTEFHGGSDDELEESAMHVIDIITSLGGNDDDTWYATTEREMEPLKAFRHAIPEAVNLLIGERKRSIPELTKLGTDMSVPDSHLQEIMNIYNIGLRAAGLESVIFGHIGNNHLHVNILPHSMQEYELGKELYLDWAKQVIAFGGSISAEHGIGKIKTQFLRMMYGEEGIAQMRAFKSLFDPDMSLNPGNLF